MHDTPGSAIDLGRVPARICAPVLQKGCSGIRKKAALNPHGLVDIHDAGDGVCVQDSYDIYINDPPVINAKEATAVAFGTRMNTE